MSCAFDTSLDVTSIPGVQWREEEAHKNLTIHGVVCQYLNL